MIAAFTDTNLWSGWSGATSPSFQPWSQPVQSATTPEPENETSFQLLLRPRTGAPDAREQLCARYLPRLHRWARGRLPAGARGALDTGDIVQEVLMHALEHVPVFEPRHEWSFQAYLRRSLMNRILDEARRVKRRPAPDLLDSDQASLEPSPLERVIGIEAIERYERALARLRPQDQQAIVARCEWGMSHEEVAELLGKPTPAAAQVAVHRAIVRLAKEMAREQPRS
jgi:RNA polymerase sigma factor (sigma-70 family)